MRKETITVIRRTISTAESQVRQAANEPERDEDRKKFADIADALNQAYVGLCDVERAKGKLRIDG